MAAPLVSIGMPVFNAERTLAVAIRSVLRQTYENWELLIVDDGSTDRSTQIAGSFRDARIRILPGGDRKGISARLNQLIAASRGKYFARMDGDDISFAGRIERQVAYLEAHPDTDLLGAAVIVFRDDGSLAGRPPVLESHEAICARPWNGFYLPHPTWLGRREWFARYGYDARADGAEDQHLLFRSYRASRFSCLPDVLLGYRENRRTFGRMWRRRYVLAKTFIAQSFGSGAYGIALKVSLVQTAKVTGDFLNIFLGMKGMRSRLDPVDAATREEWLTTWRSSVNP